MPALLDVTIIGRNVVANNPVYCPDCGDELYPEPQPGKGYLKITLICKGGDVGSCCWTKTIISTNRLWWKVWVDKEEEEAKRKERRDVQR